MTTPTYPDAAQIHAAVADAHLPALLMALIHITGDTSALDGPRPVYDPFDDPRSGGFSPELQAEIRAKAVSVLTEYFAGQRTLPAAPAPEVIRRMLDYLAGVQVPEAYVPLLTEELSLDGQDPKRPAWTASELNPARAEMKVVIIGAGMSGMLAAIRLKQAGVSFEILEKNDDVGGTWLENSYPGCRVDNPSHLYSYSFEPNHAWPYHYSTQDVLREYFREVADKHQLRSHIRFGTSVLEARFDERDTSWEVRVRRPDGAEEVLRADVVISAVGQLNQPRLPDIPGVGRFQGPAFHSARWRHDVDLEGKRVAVIGTGASAYQFVPEIAPTVAHLDVYQRTPPWLAPTADYHDPVSPGEQWLLEHVPYYERWYRFALFWSMTDGVLDMVRGDPAYSGPDEAVSEANLMLREMLVQQISAQLQDRPDLLQKVVPTYPPGGKRMVRDNGVWLSTLKRDNVELITTPIAEIAPEGLITADGELRPADVLIYGTGFRASDFLRTFKVRGRDGRDLHEVWSGDPRAYLGMTVPGFPNFFMLYGPNTNIVVNGSIIFFSECSVRYVLGCLELLLRTGARAIEVRPQTHESFNARVDEANRWMAWGAPNVTSWYKNADGRVTQNWPFRLVDYWNATLQPDPADYRLLGITAAERALTA